MNSQIALPIDASASTAYPTAADLYQLPGAPVFRGSHRCKDTQVYCRGVLIGILREIRYSAKPGETLRPSLRVTVRSSAGKPNTQVPGHDLEWLLREHIDEDLGGRTARLGCIRAGVSFVANSAFALPPRELEHGQNWYVPIMGRLDVLEITPSNRVVFRWNIPYVPDDVLARARFIHDTTDSVPLETFERLVAERLLVPMKR